MLANVGNKSKYIYSVNRLPVFTMGHEWEDGFTATADRYNIMCSNKNPLLKIAHFQRSTVCLNFVSQSGIKDFKVCVVLLVQVGGI